MGLGMCGVSRFRGADLQTQMRCSEEWVDIFSDIMAEARSRLHSEAMVPMREQTFWSPQFKISSGNGDPGHTLVGKGVHWSRVGNSHFR